VTPRDQLRAARVLIEGRTVADGGAWARSAALLGRQALEAAALRALQSRYPVRAHAPFRARFLALRAVLDERLAQEAHHTWAALSRATHHHSYALPPTAGELGRWLDTVEVVLGDTPSLLG
jgi:hypothetical protein